MNQVGHEHRKENKNEHELTQLSLFDEQAIVTEQTIPSACPDTAIDQWKSFYEAIAKYSKQLDPTKVTKE